MKKPSKPPMVPFSVDLGLYLKEKRVNSGLTQQDLADELGYNSPQMVSNWERGLCGPKFSDLIKLAKVCKISSQELIEVLMESQEKIFRSYLKKRKAK